jgi:hypothetical protein
MELDFLKVNLINFCIIIKFKINEFKDQDKINK